MKSSNIIKRFDAVEAFQSRLRYFKKKELRKFAEQTILSISGILSEIFVKRKQLSHDMNVRLKREIQSCKREYYSMFSPGMSWSFFKNAVCFLLGIRVYSIAINYYTKINNRK